MKNYEFIMNDRTFKIKKVNQTQMYEESNEVYDGKGNYFGKFLPYKQEVWLDEKISGEQARKSLLHELTHCYIWSYMTILEQLNEEDVCYISSNSHDIIHEIVNNYFSQ
jgi:hypothetical protein